MKNNYEKRFGYTKKRFGYTKMFSLTDGLPIDNSVNGLPIDNPNSRVDELVTWMQNSRIWFSTGNQMFSMLVSENFLGKFIAFLTSSFTMDNGMEATYVHRTKSGESHYQHFMLGNEYEGCRSFSISSGTIIGEWTLRVQCISAWIDYLLQVE